jgi:broad specificity phosphatase PhoE
MSSSKKIILIRHAESINNVAKRETLDALGNLQKCKSLPTFKQLSSAGSLLTVPMDTDLSQQGIDMVINLQKILTNTDFIRQHQVEIIIHSPLIRAKKTCYGLFSEFGEYTVIFAYFTQYL